MPRNESSRPAGKRPLRALTPQEKIDAINRVHNGESKAAVARDIGVPESTLRGWCKAEQKIRTQLNNMRASGSYEHILTTSSSDNSDNSGAGSSSRSTPTAQTTMLGLPSTSVVGEKVEEFEASLSHKRVKVSENSSASAMPNNISTPARASLTSDPLFNPYFYNMITTDPAKTLAFFNLMKGDTILPFTGYSTPASNLLADSLLPRNNGAMANMTIANIIKQQQQHQQQQQQQANNTLLNKRKHSAPPGLTSTTDIPKVSSRRQNSQSPNAEKSFGSTSQQSTLINSQASPIPSTSTSNGDAVASVPMKSSKNGKSLNSIICTLQQQHVPQVCNINDEMISNNAMNNNNNNVDHVDNETANRTYPKTLPPGFSDIVIYCTKLVEWLQIHGTPICTFQQIGNVKSILASLNNWARIESEARRNNDAS